MFAALIGVAAIAVSTVGVASAGDARQVAPDASLRYRVWAYNDHFDGARSREARVARVGKPAKISRRPSDGNVRISVCWSKSAGEPTHYEIMRRLESEKASAIRVVATAADDGNDSNTWRQCHLDSTAATDTEYVQGARRPGQLERQAVSGSDGVTSHVQRRGLAVSKTTRRAAKRSWMNTGVRLSASQLRRADFGPSDHA